MATPFTTAKTETTYPTAAQFRYLEGLMGSKDLTGLRESYRPRAISIREALLQSNNITDPTERGEDMDRFLASPLTRKGASTLIDLLKDCPTFTTITTITTITDSAESEPEVDDGYYVLEGQDGDGVIVTKVYKVVTSQTSGRPYAKVLEGTSWEYAPGGVRALALNKATPLTLERAQELGQLYGVCVRCGRTLTDEGSIERGIGPICAAKF